MKKVHAVAAYFVTAFVVIHLFNHLLSVMGAATHVYLMNQLRTWYRHPILEIMLLIAVATQMVTGIKLVLRNRKTPKTGLRKWQMATGIYLASFLLIHLCAIAVARLVLHIDTNYYFAVAGIYTYPYYLFFIPYYALAILSFFGHLAIAHANKMTRNIAGLSPHRQAKLLFLLGVFVCIVIFYGLTDRFEFPPLPEPYTKLFSN